MIVTAAKFQCVLFLTDLDVVETLPGVRCQRQPGGGGVGEAGLGRAVPLHRGPQLVTSVLVVEVLTVVTFTLLNGHFIFIRHVSHSNRSTVILISHGYEIKTENNEEEEIGVEGAATVALVVIVIVVVVVVVVIVVAAVVVIGGGGEKK